VSWFQFEYRNSINKALRSVRPKFSVEVWDVVKLHRTPSAVVLSVLGASKYEVPTNVCQLSACSNSSAVSVYSTICCYTH